jgi:tetratricopeptide (TPR) repeat protein
MPPLIKAVYNPPPALSASWAPSPSPPPSPVVRIKKNLSVPKRRLVDTIPAFQEANRVRSGSDSSVDKRLLVVDTVPAFETKNRTRNRTSRSSETSSTVGTSTVSSTRKQKQAPEPRDLNSLRSLEKALSWHMRHERHDRDSQIAALYNRIGNEHFRQRDYPKAVYYYKQAVQCHADLDHVAAAFANLGTVYWSTGDVGQALAMLHQALETYEFYSAQQRKPVESLEVAGVHHQLGLVFALKRDFDKAVESLQKAFAIRERTTGARSILTAKTVDALGKVYNMMGDVQTALQCHERALDILNGHSVNTCIILENILAVHIVRGDDAVALHVYAQVLLQQRTAFAQSLSREAGLQVANTLKNMSLLCLQTGRDQEANLYQQEAAAIFQQAGLKER